MRKITFKSNYKKEYPEICFHYNHQLTLISNLYLNNDFDYKEDICRFIKHKLNSYQQQDLKQKRDTLNISYDDTIEKLLKCKLKCYYCKHSVNVFYKLPRDKSQWTLDRIDNSINHSKDNVVISCLGCNIKRGKKNSQDFLSGTQLQVVKSI
jgi:hypothetical protein